MHNCNNAALTLQAHHITGHLQLLNAGVMCLAGAQSIAYYAGQSSALAFAAAQADSISTCLLKASTSVDPTVQVCKPDFSPATCTVNTTLIECPIK